MAEGGNKEGKRDNLTRVVFPNSYWKPFCRACASKHVFNADRCITLSSFILLQGRIPSLIHE
ncbi:hypothetical protein C5O12_00590 [Akkermansia muciniphila]|jgi:hypothetical protein|nr:hypothetical protein CXU05_09075 [Akkermansia muciniphila]QAA47180.1 hypothetical protein C1O40_00585 [Akkermansia muciniphila]QAA58759.1 hypothetical protein C1O57_00560 [Akkermansia muciniphila]QAA61096.1 hypothetical protein C1O59_00585 [Akkermansia muciniphila]QAR50264.1 hypothetical protein SI90_06985 [Akkermansia muciniphila]